MKLYKLTNIDGQSGLMDKAVLTQWKIGQTVSLPAKSNSRLCTGGVIHAYKNANLSLLLNSIHANFSPLRLWEGEGDVVAQDWGKVGCFALTLTSEIPLPEWFSNKVTRRHVMVQFAILCAEAVLSVFEDRFPNDLRPRAAIEAANAANAAANVAYVAYVAANAANAANAAAEAGVGGLDFGALADKAVKLIMDQRGDED